MGEMLAECNSQKHLAENSFFKGFIIGEEAYDGTFSVASLYLDVRPVGRLVWIIVEAQGYVLNGTQPTTEV